MNPVNLVPEETALATHNPQRAPLARTAAIQASSELSFNDYWRILVKRRWTILTSVVVVVTLALLISLRMTPIYDGVVRINWTRQVQNFFKDDQNNGVSEAGNDPLSMETQVRILQSTFLELEVIHNLRLDQNPYFAGKHIKTNVVGQTVAEADRQQLVRDDYLLRVFQNNLKVQQVGNTSLIEIRFSNPNPQLAADIANAIARAYIDQNVKSKFESTMQAADLLSRQLDDLQTKVEASEAKLVDYQKDHGLISTDDKTNLTFEKLGELNKELTEAQGDMINKKSLFQLAKVGNVDALDSVLSDNVITQLRQQQNDLQSQYAQLSTQFGPAYPTVVQIQNRLKQVNQQYHDSVNIAVERLKNDYDAAAQRAAMLKSAVDEQTFDANRVNEDRIQLNVLQQQADSNRTLYFGLLTKLKEASLEAGLNSTNIRIVDPARLPLRPARPNILLNVELALVLGLVGGVAMIFVLEALDMSVRTPDQIESVSGLPTVGIIPLRLLQEKGAKQNIAPTKDRGIALTAQKRPMPITFEDPQSEVSEAYRALRTSLLLSTAGHHPRVVLFTSAMPQDGKTTTSVNTAITMAQQGKRVLLIDADMRRPMLAKIFDVKTKFGLSNVLSGGSKPEDVIQPTFQPNLFLLGSGQLPPHPSELLGSALMESLLKLWREQFDHVVIDSPPVLSATDGVLLSTQVDTTVLVVRGGRTTIPALRRARDLLLGVNANIGGIVVNAVDLSSPDYYYYYSGYGYKYGYRYGGYRYGGYRSDKNAPKLNEDDPGSTPEPTDNEEKTGTNVFRS